MNSKRPLPSPTSGTARSRDGSNPLWLYLFASLGVFLAIMLLSAFWLTPRVESTPIQFREQPLQKQMHTLYAGEYYRYQYLGNNSQGAVEATFTYTLLRIDNCTAIYIQESSNRTPTCIDRWGNDEARGNLSLNNPFIYFFRPWMLAVHDTWTWEATAYLPLPSGDVNLSTVRFSTVDTETIADRPAYRVRAVFFVPDDQEEVIYWVDQEKRVLLLEQGPGYEIRLVASSLG